MSEAVLRKITACRRDLKSSLLRLAVWLAAGITMSALLFVVGYILMKGLPYLRPELFSIRYTTENVSLLPALRSEERRVGKECGS